MPDRSHWLKQIARLDPVADHAEIYRITASHEFPWDVNQALSFALLRTYAVPSIGRLLFETGEFTGRTQKRYDDTVLVLDDVLVHGLGSPRGRTAVRRMNQMHGMYAISNDDMRYVLATFVVVPVRWLDDFGWRPMSEAERVAGAEYYKALGAHMNIKGVPDTYEGFVDLMDAYEAEHFAFDPGARAVADATLDLVTTFPPNNLMPAPLVRRFSYALMDEPLLDAFAYPHPSAAFRRASRAAMRGRGRMLTFAPPRREAKAFAELPSVRTTLDADDVSGLGTFTPTCPVDLQRRPG